MSFTKSPSSRKFVWLFALMVAGCCQLFVATANAALIQIPAPPSVLLGALTSQDDGYIFLESLSVLAGPLAVDIDAPGLYNRNSPDSPGVIPQGTSVLSYMIHHESVNTQPSSIIGSFFFPYPVLGIIFNDATLDLSDPVLGNNPATLYPTGAPYRGFDLTLPVLSDTIFWSSDMRSVTFRSNTLLLLDQMRVIVSVPEPATIWLAALAGGCLFFGRFRARPRQ